MFCTIKDKYVSQQGFGKGRALQGELSGRWEALEHYLLQNSDDSRCPVFDLNELYQKDMLIPDRDILRALQKGLLSGEFKCLKFEELITNSIAYTPLEWLDPFFETERLPSVPITNSGTSVGGTYVDALLHSINELIERQMESNFYLSVILPQKTSEKVCVVDRALSEKNRSLRNVIEKKYKTKVTVVYLGTMCGVYTFGAFASVDFCKMTQTGYGASLSPDYAMTRAITELLQAFDLYNDERYTEDEAILMQCKNRPGMLKIYNLNLDGLKKDYLQELPIDNSIGKSPEMQVNEIISKLKTVVSKIYVGEVWKSNVNDRVCLRVIIPEFEKLDMLRSGVLVLPSTEGFNRYKKACQ